MGDGTEKNPYTRKDVLRLIKKNGGTAKGLNLSRKYFEDGIDLRELDLKGIILKGAIFKKATAESIAEKGINLEFDEADLGYTIGAILENAHLEGAKLSGAHLEGAYLNSAHLEGADLEKAHLRGARLSNTHLEEAMLENADIVGAGLISAHLERAFLIAADLENSWLKGAHLEEACLIMSSLKGAGLEGAHFEAANLKWAFFERADLQDTHLEGAFIEGADITEAYHWDDVDWGNYIIGEEQDNEFAVAENRYRQLKTCHAEHGLYDIAGKFFYREMEARRKEQSWKKPHLKIWYWILRMLCGYGEKPERVGISAAVMILGLALIYFAIETLTPNSFLDSLYYSAVSFIALGYGQWAPQPAGWVKGLGVFEAFIGVFMMALFLVTFTRKMTR